MTLVLRIENAGDMLANGEPVEMRIERHRLMIGRDDGGRADWRLPDPQRTVSAEHALVEYRDGTYLLQDVSRNGIFVNGDHQRLAPREHVLVRGDRVIVGPYNIVVLDGPAPAAASPYGGGYAASAPASQEWGGWAAPITAPHEIAPPADLRNFGREPPKPVFQSGGAMLGAFAAPPPPPGGDVWGKLFGAETGAGGPPWGAPPEPVAPAPSATPAWGMPTPVTAPEPAPAAAPPPNVWGAPEPAAPAMPAALMPDPAPEPAPQPAAAAWMVPVATDEADVASPPATPPEPSLAPTPTEAPVAPFQRVTSPAPETLTTPEPAPAEAQPTAQPVAASAPIASTPAATGLTPDQALALFLEGAGLPADAFGTAKPDEALKAAGARYRALVEGLVRMMEARARAKHELGVRSTVYAKNPLKFLQGPQAAQALVQPLGAGYLEGGAAVQEAFTDLQAHQIALMLGMRDAVRATVARFGPDAIEKRAGAKGLLGSILPGQRKAQLYEAYEKEWEALAGTSDEAFLDVFAKAFRNAYDKAWGLVYDTP